MTRVSVEAWSHGDGWLSVDTGEWIADRGEYRADLTDDLREWMDENGHQWPHDDVITAWITARTGELPSGLHGDGTVWHHNLFNFADHLIDDLGFTVLSAGELGDLMITVSDHSGGYEAPTVYRSTVDELEEWADYTHATGECARGHRWHTVDTVRLHASDGADMTTYRVPDQVRVPFGDRARAYVACPECGKAVRFVNRF
ncbi:hypothetical protein GIY23_12890 [Allosaccharopolyspora coralli]|uniref:Uncharacterized protein n=1 Tax=Allosaccharopolyspora coralli TaxID=2665642 RepID=A0A5Q3Q6L8_9PSEU|nr:hypothetical protein [Allosaccharopolyspora coralli]QGK70301.1 hypothetical protein GIY23_12890 [Allosaccharopolyspora coralli]